MTEIVLTVLIFIAVTAAAIYAYRYSALSETSKQDQAKIQAQYRMIHALAKAVDRGEKHKEILSKVRESDSPESLNKLYAEIVQVSRNRDT